MFDTLTDCSNNAGVTIQILPALYGDAIHLKFRSGGMKNHHIFIDGGFQSTYRSTIKKEVEIIKNLNEIVDLFIITHTDHDHIGGVIRFINEFGNKGLVKQYWFNNAGEEVFIKSQENKISISDGITLNEYLKKLNLNPPYEITSELPDFYLHGAKLKVISPTRKVLEDFRCYWAQQEKESIVPRLIKESGLR